METLKLAGLVYGIAIVISFLVALTIVGMSRLLSSGEARSAGKGPGA
jgi:hypothetical protein